MCCLDWSLAFCQSSYYWCYEINFALSNRSTADYIGVQSAAKELIQKHSIKYVLTSRFNQDAIENFFAAVPSKGINNDTRTVVEYQSSIKHIAVNWILEQPEQGANCFPDEDAVINIIDELGSRHASAREMQADKCAVNDERQVTYCCGSESSQL